MSDGFAILSPRHVVVTLNEQGIVCMGLEDPNVRNAPDTVYKLSPDAAETLAAQLLLVSAAGGMYCEKRRDPLVAALRDAMVEKVGEASGWAWRRRTSWCDGRPPSATAP